MASLLEIKKRIGGVKNTRKITKAMELVAASKMRQFQKKAVASREFVMDLLEVLASNISSESASIYTELRESGPTLYVLYTSDKGLCGALNNKLMAALFRSSEWLDTPKEERMLVTIGRKSTEFAKNNQIKLEKSFTGVSENMQDLDALEIVDQLLEFWRENKCSRIVFIAPHYKNSFTFYPVKKQFLPFTEEMIKSHVGVDVEIESDEKVEEDGNMNMLYNPDEETVIKRLHEQIVQALFVQAFMELKAAEYSSRMMAMKNATDAAGDLIDKLTLSFNKARQAAITQEIAELAGANAAMGG